MHYAILFDSEGPSTAVAGGCLQLEGTCRWSKRGSVELQTLDVRIWGSSTFSPLLTAFCCIRLLLDRPHIGRWIPENMNIVAALCTDGCCYPRSVDKHNGCGPDVSVTACTLWIAPYSRSRTGILDSFWHVNAGWTPYVCTVVSLWGFSSFYSQYKSWPLPQWKEHLSVFPVGVAFLSKSKFISLSRCWSRLRRNSFKIKCTIVKDKHKTKQWQVYLQTQNIILNINKRQLASLPVAPASTQAGCWGGDGSLAKLLSYRACPQPGSVTAAGCCRQPAPLRPRSFGSSNSRWTLRRHFPWPPVPRSSWRREEVSGRACRGGINI